MDEQEIIRLIREKNEQGARELLRHYEPLLRYIIAPILPNVQDLEKCLSDVLLRVWEKIDSYDPQRGKWNAWLTAVARNTALNQARRQKAAQSMDSVSRDLPSADASPEEAYLQQERRREIQEALTQLSGHERLLFFRKYYYLQSTEQIASELGMTQRAVEGKLYRIKKKMRKMLGGNDNAGA